MISQEFQNPIYCMYLFHVLTGLCRLCVSTWQFVLTVKIRCWEVEKLSDDSHEDLFGGECVPSSLLHSEDIFRGQLDTNRLHSPGPAGPERSFYISAANGGLIHLTERGCTQTLFICSSGQSFRHFAVPKNIFLSFWNIFSICCSAQHCVDKPKHVVRGRNMESDRWEEVTSRQINNLWTVIPHVWA